MSTGTDSAQPPAAQHDPQGDSESAPLPWTERQQKLLEKKAKRQARRQADEASVETETPEASDQEAPELADAKRFAHLPLPLRRALGSDRTASSRPKQNKPAATPQDRTLPVNRAEAKRQRRRQVR